MSPHSAFAADKIRVETQYDARGQVLRKSQPHRLGGVIGWTEFHHDSLDRQIRLINPDGTFIRTNFLPGDEFSSVETTDENYQKRVSHFDAFGNEVHRDGYDNSARMRTSYTYDSLNRLIDIQDAKGSSYWYVYNGHGNKVFELDPNLGCREMDYDSGNRLTQQRLASGATLAYTYDGLGRVQTKSVNKDALQFTSCSFSIGTGSRTETGGAGNDNLDAGTSRLADVTLTGGSGNDTYLIRAGSGHVVIPAAAEVANGGTDTIRFVDLDLGDLTITKVSDPQNGEVLQFVWNKHGNSGSLKVALLAQHFELFEFSDGTKLSKIAFSSHDRLHLEGTGSDDLIIGSKKDDQIYGGYGNDVIDVGGAATFWQHARGQSGDDTYLIGSEAGKVWIMRESDTSGSDTVRFKDLSLANLTVSSEDYSGQGEILKLSWTLNGRSGELRLADMGSHIERFEFADGTNLSRIGFSSYDRLHLDGTDGDDFIVGSLKDDQIYGGYGNDVIDVGGAATFWQHARGQSGDDTYLIGSDAGKVWIMRDSDSSGFDTIKFKDLTVADLNVIVEPYEGQGQILRLLWTKDGRSGELRLADEGDHIERFEFADGTTLSKIALSSHDRLHLEGSDGDNLIIGSLKDDQIYGGYGNDVIDVGGAATFWQHARGQSGDDTYLIGSDAGKVWIMRNSDSSGNDIIKFKDLTVADLNVVIEPYEGQGQILRLLWNKDGKSGELRLADEGSHIEQFEFADGTRLSSLELGTVNRNGLHGTDGDDLIFGTPQDDIIHAGAGNDILAPLAGVGHWQHLWGEAGNDTYRIGKDAGNVWMMVAGEGASQGTDTVVFKDLVLADLTISTFQYEGEGNVLSFDWNKDGHVGRLQIGEMAQNIELFEFADGTKLSKIAFSSHDRLHLEGTDSDDLIIGSKKDDQIYGGYGNDVIDVGGAATFWQHARGQSGDDTYLIGSDAGKVWIMRDSDSSGFDTIKFKDLTVADLNVIVEPYEGQGQILSLLWTKDGRSGELRLADEGDHIERFEFADGTRLSSLELGTVNRNGLHGTDGNDLILGTGKDDIIHAGAGNDILDPLAGVGHWQHLWGEAGNDTYRIGKDAGNVWMMVAGEGAGQGTDTVVFKDLVLADLTISTFQYEGEGDVLKFAWNKDGHVGRLQIGKMAEHIERFEFGDGSAVRKIALTSDGRVQLFVADPIGDNFVSGTVVDDYLFGGTGNDILDAGAGTLNQLQHLRGEEGNDTYMIGRDAGNVHINYFEGANDGTDTVRFKDLALGDITISVMDYTVGNPDHVAGKQLRLSWNIGGGSGQLRIDNEAQHIEFFEFADGSVRTASELLP